MVRSRYLPAIVLLILAVLLPLETAVAKDGLRKLVTDLAGPDRKAQSRAYRILLHRKDKTSIPLIRQALDDCDLLGQHYGVIVLDSFRHSHVEACYHALLRADSPYVRLCAATALQRAGNKRMDDRIVRSLTASNVKPAMRVYMLRRVGTQPTERVMDGVRSLLKPGESESVLLEVMRRLHLNMDEMGVSQATRLLEDARANARALASAFLYVMGQRNRRTELAEALRQGVSYGVFLRVEALLATGRRVEDEIHAAIAERLSREKDARLLLRQIRFLGNFDYRKARPELSELLTHRTETIARAAFDVLVSMSGPTSDDTLRPLLRQSDVNRRLWSAEALRRRDDHSGIAVVIFALQRGTIAQRRKAAAQLGAYTVDLAVEPLLDALESADYAVRAAAAGALQRLLTNLFPYRFLRLATTGYAANADEAVRTQAAAQIRAWWRANRGADW